MCCWSEHFPIFFMKVSFPSLQKQFCTNPKNLYMLKSIGPFGDINLLYLWAAVNTGDHFLLEICAWLLWHCILLPSSHLAFLRLLLEVPPLLGHLFSHLLPKPSQTVRVSKFPCPWWLRFPPFPSTVGFYKYVYLYFSSSFHLGKYYYNSDSLHS